MPHQVPLFLLINVTGEDKLVNDVIVLSNITAGFALPERVVRGSALTWILLFDIRDQVLVRSEIDSVV